MCGGTVSLAAMMVPLCGLSPRVRGNRPALVDMMSGIRSIPACAGEPVRQSWGIPLKRVYPRVCGGTTHNQRPPPASRGLSPRVRGNLGDDHPARRLRGSIPACAGEPLLPESPVRSRQVYPRVCGGTGKAVCRAAASTGLSPRVRGNRFCEDCGVACLGSIPACAGEPPQVKTSISLYEVYPRVCGGTPPRWFRRPPSCGLSPRVRGNLPRCVRIPSGNRSIPACAGEPLELVGRGVGYGVYPRVCGGTSVVIVPPACLGGLSPRVRGNLGFGMGHPYAVRSIPACAGEPAP